tara:strand:- start:164 stop:631 length:468 start_codon:yes stop_codon:yes gene_type:complete
MIIECPNCNKKFEIDQNLVPNDGRLLQCGNCNHKWFFKINVIRKKIVSDNISVPRKDEKKETDDSSSSSDYDTEHSNEEINLETDNKRKIKQKTKGNFNYFNIFLVIIISIIALILILDTFKNNLETVFPNIKFLLSNLYQSIEDIKLFIFDLIK